MNPEIGSDPFVRPRLGQNLARRPAAAPESAALATGRGAGKPAKSAAAGPPASDRSPPTRSEAEATADRTRRPAGNDEVGAWHQADSSEAEFSFDDLVDLINPLQHIPGVSTLYREITGDQISAPARVLGGMLYGGPVGLVGAMANTIAEEVSGSDMGASVLAAIFGGDDAENAPSIAAGTGEPPLDASLAAEAASATDPEDRAAIAAPGRPPAPTTSEPAGASAAPPQATDAGKTGPLTGEAALKALAADLGGAGPEVGNAEAAPGQAANEAPQGVPVPRQLSAAQARQRAIPLRDRDWRSGEVARQPKPAPLATPGLAAAAGGASALSAGQNQALQALSAPSGQFPSPVAPELLANGPDGSAFAGRMLEALDKYSAMMGQNRAPARAVTAE